MKSEKFITITLNNNLPYTSSEDDYTTDEELPPSPSTMKPITSNSFFEKYAADYIDFTYENPTTYHVVAYFKQKLIDSGFTYVSEKESWTKLKKGGLYFTTRSGTSLIAFSVGEKWDPSKGLGMVGSHVDSLAVKLKPNSIKTQVDGYEMLGVAPYSGTLNMLWMDRDLGLGGKILYKNGDKIESKLINSSPLPIAKIPSLAEHFDLPDPTNKETQFVPVVGYGDSPDATDEEKNSPLYGRHSLKLLRFVSEISGVSISEIVQLDLDLFDVQKGVRGGLSNEFIFAPRVDDRLCSYAAIESLIAFAESADLATDANLNIVGLFDNEEIGSGTRQGAKGGLLDATVDRILSFSGCDTSEAKRLLYANSIILSADVTHLMNPNFRNAYLTKHYPLPNIGVTVKMDVNGHVTTDSTGLTLLQNVAAKNGDTLQSFHIRNDGRSGGTIGPIIACATGARTIDVGIPQLSMHSIRATFGYKDIGLGINFFTGFFASWREAYDKFGDL